MATIARAVSNYNNSELILSRNINHNTQYTQVYTLEQSGCHISVNFNGYHNINDSH